MGAFLPKTSKPLHKRPKFVQQSIPFKKVYPGGIMEHNGEFSVCFIFTDINYTAASMEDQKSMFYGYEDILNAIDPDHLAKITIMNTNMNDKDLKERMFLSDKGDGLDDYREELNQMNLDRASDGFNRIVQQKLLTVTSRKKYEEAKTWFNRVEGSLRTYFTALKSDCRRLSTFERLKLLHDFYRPGEEAYFNLNIEEIEKKGHSVVDRICPDGMEFHKNYFMIGERYGRALFLRDYPSRMRDTMIADLTDLAKQMILSIDLISKSPDEALRIIKRQITAVSADIAKYTKKTNEAGNYNALVPTHLAEKLEMYRKFELDLTQNNQRLILANVTLVHMADSLQELNDDTDNILSIGRTHYCQFGVCLYQQERGLNTCLPYGVRYIESLRTLTTESAAVMIPFTAQDVWDDGGICYGINDITKNLVVANRRILANGNAFIFGIPGSGKSFSAKTELASVFLSTDDVIIVIDPEGEFSELARIFGGQVIEVKAGSKNNINAMEMNRHYDSDDDPIGLKADSVLSLCELGMGGQIDARERSILDRCIRKLLRASKPGEEKTLNDLYDLLMEQTDEFAGIAHDIALQLEIFTKGSLNTFAKPTNVDVNNRLVVYNIKQLGNQLKAMGMMIVLDNIINRVTYNHSIGKHTWVYMDELHVLFKYDQTSRTVDDLWRRIRKYGGYATGITQNVEALLKSEHARTMISNSEFVLMLNQAHPDKKELAKMLDISPTHQTYITNAKTGCGLMRRSGVMVPFDATFNQDTKLYRAMTTKFEDWKEALKKA